jgi:hypothetical protein
MKIYATINTKEGAHEQKIACRTLDSALRRLRLRYRNWTSITLTMARRRKRRAA